MRFYSQDRRRPRAGVLLILAVFASVVAPTAGAQQAAPGEVYRIGAGDVLRLNVPQQATLDGEITVQADGQAYIPQVGEVALSGLTIAEAEEFLSQRLRLFNPSIVDVVLSVVEYNALRIFVLGAVSTPGSYTFETPPTLWEVLRAAGGPGEGANLAVCRVITIIDGRPSSKTVNLAGYHSGGEMPPDVLQSGDTLVVPTVAEGTVGVPATMGVQVFGGVATPTTVPIEEPMELLSVLMLAGAPIETAEIHKINWVHRSGGQGPNVATRVDMRTFLESGQAKGNPMVHPGDVIYLPQYRDSWAIRYLPLFLTTITSFATLLLAYDRLSE